MTSGARDNRIRKWGPTDTLSSPDSLDRMWDVINRRRADTKSVTVSVEDLIALLKDHAHFCDVCKATS